MERIPLEKNRIGRTLLLTTLAMLALGVVMVHSAVASVTAPGAWYTRVDVRHSIFACLAALVLGVGWRFDYRRLTTGQRIPTFPAIMLAAALLCSVLVFVPGIGRSVGGYHRWIRVGPSRYAVGFQPSELIKLTLVIFLAAWISRKSAEEIRSFTGTFVPAAALIVACTGLVITQDFGTAVLLGASAAAVLLLSGVPWRHLGLLIPPAALGFYALVIRDPRRWARITALFDPFSSSNPSAYQPRQSLQAIMAGGWFGKGVGRGMHRLGFLPEDSTDFIFSVYCEEWGAVGALLLLGLIILWIYTARKAALNAHPAVVDRDESGNFGRLLAASLGFLIGMQSLLHVAVALVLVPPTGVGLPFISRGGTALILMSVAVALIVSVTSRTRTGN